MKPNAKIYTLESYGLKVEIVLGNDGIPIVFIDTLQIEDGENGPKIRVRLNDEKIWDDKKGSIVE